MHTVICVGNSILYLVAVSAKGAYRICIPAPHEFDGIVEQCTYLCPYQLVFGSISGWQRKEIVVDMLFADLVDAAQVVKYAHTAVVAEIEPSAFFYRHLACQMTQAQSFLPTSVFKRGFLAGEA